MVLMHTWFGGTRMIDMLVGARCRGYVEQSDQAEFVCRALQHNSFPRTLYCKQRHNYQLSDYHGEPSQ